jgi:predicted DNA-binding protein
MQDKIIKIRMTEELKEKVKEKSKKQSMTLSAYIKYLIIRDMERGQN